MKNLKKSLKDFKNKTMNVIVNSAKILRQI